MPDYIRRKVPGGCYFFTVSLNDRTSRLLVDHVEALRDAFATTRRKFPFTIDAVVVLPDHLHAIWTLPSGDANYSDRWRRIKARFSRHIPPDESRTRTRRERHERGVWQRRFWEHLIEDATDFEHHVNYIHYNPVKHGLANSPVDWPYSSLHRYVAEGRLDATWGTNGLPHDLNLD